MEKTLTKKEHLLSLIEQIEDPFCSDSKFKDIETIIKESSSFSGMNHLYLARIYLGDVLSRIKVSKEEAIRQCNLALKEKNTVSYHILYRIYKKDGNYTKARTYLRASLCYEYPLSYYAMGEELEKGEVFPVDLKESRRYYREAISKGIKEGYRALYMLELKEGNTLRADMISIEAKEKGIYLPRDIR